MSQKPRKFSRQFTALMAQLVVAAGCSVAEVVGDLQANDGFTGSWSTPGGGVIPGPIP